MKRFLFKAISLVILMTLLLSSLPGVVQATPAGTASFNLSTAVNTTSGQIITVEIRLDASTQPIDTFDAFVNFDPAYLRVVDGSGNILTDTTSDVVQRGPLVTSDWTKLTNRVNNTLGHVDFSYGKPVNGTSINTSGVVGTFRLKAIQAAASTRIYFSTKSDDWTRNTIAASSGNDVTASRYPAFVSIGSGTGAAFNLNPSATSVGIGQTFTVDIRLDASTQSVDALDAYVDFDPACLEVIDDLGKATGSILVGPLVSAWNETQNKVDNSTGHIDFSYGAPGGVSANTSGVVGTIRFKALKVTTGTPLTFSSAFGRATVAARNGEPVSLTSTGTSVAITPFWKLNINVLPLEAAQAGCAVTGTTDSSYLQGTPIDLTATAASNWHLADWSASGTSKPSGNSIQFSMPGNDVTLTATFALNTAPTTTVVTTTKSPTVFGESVTFTATVSAASGTPTGTVTFLDGETSLGTGNLNAQGRATLTTNAVATGTLRTITAAYSGDKDYSPSSGFIDQTVNKAGTIATVVSSPATSVFGQSVTLTATVTVTSPGSGTPTGGVTFKDGNTTIGTASLTAGTASTTVSNLAVGSHSSITAVYSGDSNFNTSTSSTTTQTVNQANTTTTVSADPNPSTYGQSVTFTATVAAVSPGTRTPTGSVTFKDGITTLGPPVSLNEAGQASLTTSALLAGAHSITAVYSSDANSNTSTSVVFTQTVNKAGTTALITSNSPSTSTYGQTVTLTAAVSVTAPGAGTPTGSITFYEGSTALVTGPLSAGSVSANISTLTAGTHSITAKYNGDANFALSPNSPAVTQTVNKAVTIAVVTSAPSTSIYSQSVTFTATVSVTPPGGGIPTGTFTFKDGGATLDSRPLVAGAASFSISTLAVGAHSITAEYSGDNNFIASSTATPITQNVSKADTTTQVSSVPNPSSSDQSVTFTAVVTAAVTGSGAPSGNVTFKDGDTPLGSPVDLTQGKATFISSSLTKGTHSITAVYNGDTNFNTSNSAAYNHTVYSGNGVTSVTVTSSASPTVYGQLITFTATVTKTSGPGTPTGNVVFKDGSTILGSANLNGAKINVAVFTTNALALGDHSITVEYGGDASFKGSTSLAITQTVSKANTTAVISSLPNPSSSGQTVTLTAAVNVKTPGSGAISGNVTFYDGTTSLGMVALNAGKASLTNISLAVDTHSLTATYSGDDNFNTVTSAALSHTVNPPAAADTTTTLASSLNPSTYGQLVTFTAAVSTNVTGTPSGKVAFLDGTSTLATVALAAGSASFTTSTLAVGNHTITAVYGGDSAFNGSNSASVIQMVARANQIIVFNPLSDKYYGDPAFLVNAAASSGLSVDFSISGPAALSGNLVSIIGTGDVTVTASQPGNEIYAKADDVSRTFHVNPGIPVFKNLSAPVITENATPTSFGGKLMLGTQPVSSAGVSITLGTGTPVTVTTNSTGDFSYDFTTSSLTAGSYPIIYSYTGAGNYASVTDRSKTLVVNLPDVILQSIILSPANPTVTFVAGNPPSLQFSAIAVYSNGSRLDITSIPGIWSVGANDPVALSGSINGQVDALAAGTATITAQYGSKSGWTTLTIKPDTAAPVINLNSPANGLILPDGTTQINVSGNITGYPVSAQVIVNGNTPVELSLSPWAETRIFNQVVSISPSGYSTVQVKAVDQASNLGQSATRSLQVKTNPIPVVTILSPASGQVTNGTSIVIQGTVTSSTAVTLKVNKTTYTPTLDPSGSFNQSVTLATGTNMISATAYAEGHPNQADFLGSSGVKIVTVDQTLPVITITSPADGAKFGTPDIVVTGTIDDPGITQATLTLGTETIIMPVASGSFSQAISLPGPSNTITVSATDKAGNQGSSSITVTYDDSLPTVIVTSPINNLLTKAARIDISGEVYYNIAGNNANKDVFLYENGTEIDSTTTDANGSFTFQGVSLGSGSHVFMVITTIDNKDGSSGDLTITQDSVVPTLTTGLSEPADTITITVTSSEPLSGDPVVTVGDTSVDMEWTEALEWVGTYQITADGNYTVTASGTDIAGNTGAAKDVKFTKQTSTVQPSSTETVTTTSGTSVQFNNDSADAVTGTIDVSQTTVSPAGNNNKNTKVATEVYLNINASAALRNVMTNIVIRIPYDPAQYRRAGIDPATVKIWLWDVTTGDWVQKPSQAFPSARPQPYIEVQLDHLSDYGAFGDSEVEYALTYNTAGTGTGSISAAANVDGIDVAYSSGDTIPAGTVVALTAAASTDSTFTGWSGSISGTTNPVTFTMNSVKSVTATFTKQESGGGGGGGGGGGAATKVTPGGDLEAVEIPIDNTGAFTKAVQVKTKDGKVAFDFTQGTKILDANNIVIANITAAALTSPPAAPSSQAVVMAYTFGPDGARFIPAMTLTLKYDPAALKGVAEKDLYLAYYDSNIWQTVPSTVDTNAKTVTAKISHFSSWALLGNVTAPPTTVPPTTAPPTTVPPTTVPPTTVPPTTVPPTTVPPTTAPPTTAPPTSAPPTSAPPTTPPTPPSFPVALVLAVIGAIIVVVTIILVIRRRRE